MKKKLRQGQTWYKLSPHTTENIAHLDRTLIVYHHIKNDFVEYKHPYFANPYNLFENNNSHIKPGVIFRKNLFRSRKLALSYAKRNGWDVVEVIDLKVTHHSSKLLS